MRRFGGRMVRVLAGAGGACGRGLVEILWRTLQMPEHPVAALMWVSAVVCTIVVPIALIAGVEGWMMLAVLAGLLWGNALLGRVFEAAFRAWDTRRRIVSVRWGSAAGWRSGRPGFRDRRWAGLRRSVGQSWSVSRSEWRKVS